MNTAHYPSLELCKKLTEIGFPDTNNFMVEQKNKKTGELIGYMETPEDRAVESIEGYIPEKQRGFMWTGKRYKCPSVMEMLDVMPKEIPYTIKVSRVEVPVHRNLVIGKNTTEGGFYCKYVYGTMHGKLSDNQIIYDMNTEIHKNGTLPNALAEMVLWLYENNYISFTK